MSAKGKERATNTGDDGSDDSDVDFFTVKKKTVAVPRYSPPPVVADTNDVSDEYDSEDGVRRKKARKKKDKLDMPEWTKAKPASPSRNKKRGSTESRGRSSSSQADIIGSPDKGKGNADGKRRKRVLLTPPPEITAAQKAEVSKRVAEHFNPTQTTHEARDVVDMYSSDHDDRGDVVTIRVRMRSDPARVRDGASMKAISHWEKLRTFKFNRRDPFSILVEDLAKRVSKEPEELVLIYGKQRIRSTRLTPDSFGITDEADMEGYEKHVWESLEKSHLGMWDKGPSGLVDGDLDQATVTEDGHAAKETTAASVPNNAIVVHIRCEWGEEKLGLQPTHTVKKLIRHYARKHGKESEIDRLVLEFDGDQCAPSQTIADVGLESGDLVDLIVK